MLSWVAERSVDALRPALLDLMPELRGEPITLHDSWIDTGDPAWFRSSAFIGSRWVVKFAWSRPAAAKLGREIDVLRALAGCEMARLPPLHAFSLDPVMFVTDFEPGSPLTWELAAGLDTARKRSLAAELAMVSSAVHSGDAMRAVRDAGLELPPPTPQATTSALRDRLAPLLDERRRRLVLDWCDLTDGVLSGDDERVVLHGDMHGYNLVLDERLSVRRALDVEEASLGDYHYDFRYLPGQEPSVELFRLTAERYQELTGRPILIDRVIGWQVRTVLGDALWRTEAGVALPDGGTVPQWIDTLEQRIADLRAG